MHRQCGVILRASADNFSKALLFSFLAALVRQGANNLTGPPDGCVPNGT